MKEELIEIRNNLLSALEQNDVILAKMYINKLDTLLHKQIKCYCGHTTYCECGPEELKQETLEEASERFYPFEETFIEGAKWQQKRMYSEEDIREAIHESRMQDDKYEDCIFEQFKKK